MPAAHRQNTVQGFAIHTLTTAQVSVSLAPALGGRVVSLHDRTSGREWLDGWQPARARRLWAPADPSDFATGPGAGIDECLPTVLPSKHGKRPVPDHGDVWTMPVEVDPAGLARGRLVCRWALASLPLNFTRVITVRDDTVRFAYTLENRANQPTPYLWAWHALFSLKRGDTLAFAKSIDTCLAGGARVPWPVCAPGSDLSRAEVRGQPVPCAKIFVGPLRSGAATLRQADGAALDLRWPAKVHPYAGVWITRGFWKGLHHWAVEPTNAPVDRLEEAVAAHAPHSWLGPRETKTWFVTARVRASR
jgi:hypothetical protein